MMWLTWDVCPWHPESPETADRTATVPSPRCGRIDRHPAHVWTGRHGAHVCPGHTVTEGGQPCVECQRPAASCQCEFWRQQERAREWSA